ncbi:DUF5335 family protein [Reichenbachiella ulvae]|uniref:DUF5335 family protein n=1 Tax=Reichenbachiella ulvae TaxID=2980104 RepID=A0ABT3CRZ5_9BACT|nr:DUF5335 family protein [Reichenbachiella ulvae]MCV9386284.1 DUF5335 family protein [Reichenbachiella ulvae]
MSIRKQLDNASWQDRLQSITSGNSGRTAAIAAEGTTLVEQKNFISIGYDPIGKGNDIFISLADYDHKVFAPVELFIEEDEKGRLLTVEIIDQNSQSNYLRFM